MHLVYVYIYKDNNSIINKQEFTLSSKWNIHYDEDASQIIIDKNDDYYNIFSERDASVNSLSVVVGANGAGKTSFLMSLMNLTLIPYEDRQKDKQYLDFNIDQKEKSYGIKIFEDNEYVRVYQNISKHIKVKIDGDDIKQDSSDITDKRHSYTYIQNGYFSRVYDIGQKTIEKTTNVYLSNSNHHYDTGFDDKGYIADKSTVSSIYLTQKTIDILNSFFLRRNSLIKDIEDKSNFTYFQDLLSKKNSKNRLNQLLILRYLNTVGTGNEFYEGYQLDKYTIGTDSLSSNIREILKNNNGKFSEADILLKKLNIEILNDRCDLIENMKLNLCFEYVFVYPRGIDINLGSDYISISVEKLYQKVLEAAAKTDHDGYYNNAINEISELSRIVDDLPNKKYTSNKLPSTDLAYPNLLTLYFKSNESQRFIEFIERRIDSNFSFILKYLRFNFGMSSGELASLSIFAWIYSLPILNKLDNRIIESTNEDILLLVDEAELYAHPDWQRQFISALVVNANNMFKNKNVQLVIATHSPLILSDVPNDDVIYLDKCKNVTGSNEGKKTFGSNIYNLYRDAFFLNTTIGKYSENKIDNVINYIENQDGSILNQDEALYIIRNIGEPVLEKLLKVKFGLVKDND